MPALAVFSKKLTLLSVRKLSFQIDAGRQYTQTGVVNKEENGLIFPKLDVY